MKLDALRNIQNESQRVNAIYELFQEEHRLNRSPSARVEFLTTVRYIEQYLSPGQNILDLGAGTGEYSLHFAKKGFPVTAIELATANVEAFRRKLSPDINIDLRQGNALDLSAFADNSFDVVLVFGPLYHLEKEKDRFRCIREAMRVCKPSGRLFFSFISNDMVILTELMYRPDFFLDDTYDHETFKVEDFPFVFFTVEQCREMLLDCGVKLLLAVGSDGVSELMQDQIDRMDESSYAQYLRYHFYCCEKPEMLGRSNHLLFIGKK